MIAEQIESIVKKEQNIIPLLKTLSPEQKRELVPFLKKLKETIYERYEIVEKTTWGNSLSFKPKHSEVKRDIVDKACYVCFNKADIKKAYFNVSNLSVSDAFIEHIIPWYKPNWYSDLINEDIPWQLNYEKMMLLYKKEWLQPSPALIIARLPNAIIESTWENNKNRSIYKPEVLLQHKETLEEHIWLLFEENSGINNYYRYLHLENYKGGNDVWIDTISNLTIEHKLERRKVLIATIYTATKGFNKNLSGWFFELLLKLNPDKEELLDLQDELFAALNSPHSKVINTVLKFFKLIATQKNFKHSTFIENASILLNSETKSIVNSTLMILDKIAKTHKEHKSAVAIKASEALINLDESIQLRAAKIIGTYGDTDNEDLLEEINLYSETIFHTSKEILNDYIVSTQDNEDTEAETIEMDVEPLLSENNKLPTYETLDDLIFFVSQSIDNNDVYHIDFLLSYLPKLNKLLTKHNVATLEPIFKRSFDLSMNFDFNSQIGQLEFQATCFINDFAELCMQKFPVELENFRKTKDEKIQKLNEDRYYNSHYKNRLKDIEHQTISDYIYQIHRTLFIHSKSFIKKGVTLDLLSTPTHDPCWVDPKVLIERIRAYEAINEEFNLCDFQIAIGRLPLNETPKDIGKLIDTIKGDDIKTVLRYQYDKYDIQKDSLTRPELWLQSVLSKNSASDLTYFKERLANPLQKEMGTYDWDCKLRDHFYMDYDYATNKRVQKKMTRKELKLIDFDSKKKEADSILSSIKSMFNKKNKTIEIPSMYNYMFFKKEKYYTTIQPNDDVRFLFLSPNNPSMFLSQVIHNNLKESTFFDESSKKNMVNILKGLYRIWYRIDFKESTYLFLATGLVCSDQVSRELAAEIWIKANSQENMKNEVLGNILGTLECGEYAPLKRFADLLSASLFNVSKRHNESLFVLLDGMIGKMDKTPIRGLKKLLELFLELKRSFPDIEISDRSKENLSIWKNTKTLNTLVNKIIID